MNVFIEFSLYILLFIKTLFFVCGCSGCSINKLPTKPHTAIVITRFCVLSLPYFTILASKRQFIGAFRGMREEAEILTPSGVLRDRLCTNVPTTQFYQKLFTASLNLPIRGVVETILFIIDLDSSSPFY